MTKAKKRKPPYVPIDKLLAYWTDLSKRSQLTKRDYRTFIRRSQQTLEHFEKFSARYVQGDSFLHFASLCFHFPEKVFKDAYTTQELSDNSYAMMKDFAAKFVARIKKCFGEKLVRSRHEKTPLQDAQDLLLSSTKLTYKWAAGIIASNHIAKVLIRLSRFKRGENYKDDIMILYDQLKKRTQNSRLKIFLNQSYRRFENANKTRNRCAHVTQGDPTRQEIEQSISLGLLLQRFV